MNNSIIYKSICEHIDYLLHKGFCLISEGWGNPQRKLICPLGASLLMHKIDYSSYNEMQLYQEINKLYSVSDNWIEAFNSGVDECPFTPEWKSSSSKEIMSLKNAYQLGVKIKERYQPTPTYLIKNI